MPSETLGKCGPTPGLRDLGGLLPHDLGDGKYKLLSLQGWRWRSVQREEKSWYPWKCQPDNHHS